MDIKLYIGKEIKKVNKKVTIDFVNNPEWLVGLEHPDILAITIKNGLDQFTISTLIGISFEVGIDKYDTAQNYYNYLNTLTFPGWLSPYISFQFDTDRIIFSFSFDSQDNLEFTTLFSSTTDVVISETTSYDTSIDFERLDLFGDETIELTAKLSDIEKLSNVFMDFSNTFTIPATDNNNTLLKHYYDSDIIDPINANIRMLGYIEIDSLPFRYGKLELNAVNKKSFRPSSYKMTFYSGLLQLTDLFGEDVLSELDYEKDDLGNLTKVYDSISKYSFDINTSTIGGLLSGTYSTETFIPLINSGEKKWDYNTGVNDDNNKDILSDTGAISTYELRPALRIIRIIEAIENKYGVVFTRDFFGKAFFNNLFLWLNGTNKKTMYLNLTNQFTEQVAPLPGNQAYNPYLDFTDNTVNIQMFNVATRQDIFTMTLYWPYSSGGNLMTYDNTDFSLTVSYEDMRPGREGNVFYTKTKSFTNGDLHHFQSDFSAATLGMTYDEPLKFRIRLDSSKPLIWSSVRFETSFTYNPNNGFRYYYMATGGTYNNYELGLFMPQTKVLDFLQNIMKMFKLVITPVKTDLFYVNTIDGYYEDGNVIRLDDYVDNTNIDIEPLKIYNRIKFLYDKTNNVLGKKYRELKDPVLDEIGYGDLRANYNSVEYNNSLDVKVSFDNMLYERLDNASTLAPVNFLIGESIQVSETGDVSSNQSKPIIFFDNGIVTTAIKFKIGGLSPFTQTKVRLIGTTDNKLLEQVTHTLNFGAEIDPWHNIRIDNSLYLNYWDNWIKTIYSTKQRKYTLDANLPSILIDRLTLNDRIIISDNRYKINDFTVDLTTGKVKFVLFNDIYEPYSLLNTDYLSGFTNDNRLYSLVDYTESSNNGSHFLYGRFVNYSTLGTSKLVKLKSNGNQDFTFDNTLGGPDVEPVRPMSIFRNDDDSLYVAGSFSTYNGLTNSVVVKLNPNGTLDNTSTFDSFGGSFRYGNKVIVDSNNNILVGGSFSKYGSKTSNSLVRLNPDLTYDSSFNVGVGFNGPVTDIKETTIGTMSSVGYYVAGNFTQYKGSTYNGLVKLKGDGTYDTSFSIGSGLTTNNKPVYLLTDGTSVIAAGGFTQYKGVTASRIVKITATGSVDNTFTYGSGFNGDVYSIRYMLDNSIFISGSFSSYNGASSSNAVIINTDGTIKQSFEVGYESCYCVDNDVYGVKISPTALHRLTDNSLLDVVNTQIYQNAGRKYYAIEVLGTGDWIVQKVDLGYGVSWIDINTPSGTGAGEISITIKNNPSTSRKMAIKIISGSINKWVSVYQDGI